MKIITSSGKLKFRNILLALTLFLSVFQYKTASAQNFHIFMTMELVYNDSFAAGKFQWVSRMFMYKDGTGGLNDRRLTNYTYSFSYDTTKIKNPRYYVIHNKYPILAARNNYTLTQGIYTIDTGNRIVNGLPSNHIRYDVVINTTQTGLTDSLYVGADFNTCFRCGEVFRVYFDIDSSGSNQPPAYMINGDENPVYWNQSANGFLADTVYGRISLQHGLNTAPANPVANPWLYWPYDGLTGGFGGGLPGSWALHSGGTGSWSYGGFENGVLTPLPLTFISFNTTVYDRKIRLNWITDGSDEFDVFGIERSSEGNVWTSIGSVINTSGESGLSSFEFIDEHPLNELNYYRISYTDASGKKHYSDIRQQRINDLVSSEIVLFPNPAASFFVIQYSAGNDELLEFEIQSSSGKVLKSGSFTDRIIVNTNDLCPGIYFIQIRSGNELVLKKLVIE